jgi:hypothetical protein
MLRDVWIEALFFLGFAFWGHGIQQAWRAGINTTAFQGLLLRLVRENDLSRAIKISAAAGDAPVARVAKALLLAQGAARGAPREETRAYLVELLRAQLLWMESELTARRVGMLRGAVVLFAVALLWKVGVPVWFGRAIFLFAFPGVLAGLVWHEWMSQTQLQDAKKGGEELARELAALAEVSRG